MSCVFLAMATLFPLQGVQAILPTLEVTQGTIVPYAVLVDRPIATPKPQAPETIKGSQQPTTEIPYGEIFNEESEKLPFYLKPGFDGLDASDHRREVRPNAAGQRLDMDQYNRQVRPSVGP